ncbi:MAG: glycosyltransferase family 2 protein [Gemmatimonadaceae bacterium]
MTSRIPVTVVIAARDEGVQIADCVRSASFAAEVLVVENDSTDDTVAEAREAGAVVFSHPFLTIGGQRNAAIERASCDWILVLDADERATPALGDELAKRLASAGPIQAWRLGRRNFFFGGEIRHGGWGGGRDRPVRFFRRRLRYDERPVHEHVLVDGAIGELDERIRHEPYATLDEYFEKLVRYSRDWAAQHYARGRRASLWSVVVRPPARFFAMLILRGGFRDGARGVLLAVLAAMSVAAKYAFLWEHGLRGAAPDSSGRP